MIPGISRNWRRTSTMIDWAVLPTARIASELKKYTSIAPIRAAMKTLTLARLTESRSAAPGSFRSDRLGGLADRADRERAEEVHEHRADQGGDEDADVGQVDRVEERRARDVQIGSTGRSCRPRGSRAS